MQNSSDKEVADPYDYDEFQEGISEMECSLHWEWLESELTEHEQAMLDKVENM